MALAFRGVRSGCWLARVAGAASHRAREWTAVWGSARMGRWAWQGGDVRQTVTSFRYESKRV